MVKRTVEKALQAKLYHDDLRAISLSQDELRSAIFREYAERVASKRYTRTDGRAHSS